MEKRKLLESIKAKPKTQLYLSSTFYKDKDNTTSATLLELYDNSIIIYKVVILSFRILKHINHNKGLYLILI